MENQLTYLIEKINEAKVVASKDLSAADPKTRAALKGHIVRAKENLKDLYFKYRNEIRSKSVFILVTGSQSEEFAKIAQEECGCFDVKADSFYEDLVDQVPSHYYNKLSSPALFEFFSAKFGDRALDIDIIAHRPLLFEAKYKKQLTGRDSVVDLMKRAFNDKVGGDIVGLDAIERVASKVVNENFDGRFCPIILHSKDSVLIQELAKDIGKHLTPKTFVFTTGAKVNKDLKNVTLSHVKSVTLKTVEQSLSKAREQVN